MTVAMVMVTVIVVAMMVGNSNAMARGKFTVVVAMLVAMITPMTTAVAKKCKDGNTKRRW